jgi:hypothetical protein
MLLAAVILLLSSASTDPSIIVTGRNISDKKAALAACLARKCRPDEDIDATLALAETLLISGKYRDARFELLGGLGRNKRFAASYPIPVSDLYRANGRVAAHLGIDEDYYRSTWGIYSTLKKGMPDAKVLQYSAMMEVAEMMAVTRGHDTAREYYRSIIHHAREDGRPDIAALAELRMILRHYPEYARENAIREIAESADPKTRAAQLEAQLAIARIAYARNDEAKGDAIVRSLTKFEIQKPILVYAPRWDVERGPANPNAGMVDDRDVKYTQTFGAGAPGGDEISADPVGARERSIAGLQSADGRPSKPIDSLSRMSPYGPHSFASYRMPLNVEGMWIDAGFRIAPDGRVADLQLLRSHGDVGWSRPLLASIAGRRYTLPTNSASSYRIERYTYTSGLEPGTASHGAQHSPNARVEFFDLSDIAAAN